MNRRVVLLGLVPVLLAGQAQIETKLYRLRYAEAVRVVAVLENGFQVSGDNTLRAVIVKGDAEHQAEVAKLIQEIDQPTSESEQQDVETTIYVIAASDKQLPASTIPPAMAPVLRQLKAAFPYSNYEVLDTMLLRTQAGGRTFSNGMLKQTDEGQPSGPIGYSIQFHLLPAPKSIRYDDFRFSAEHKMRADINTSFEVGVGQKVVVGKTNFDEGKSALFVVVTARLAGEK